MLVCSAALLLFDAGFNLARGSALPPAYWLLVLATSLALAGGVGALGALLRQGARPGLALWLGLEGFAWSESPGFRRWLLAAAFVLITWAVLGLRSRGLGGPLSTALSLACSFAVSILIWPRLGAALSIGSSHGMTTELTTVAVFAALLLVLSLWPFGPRGRGPGGGWLAVATMVTALLGVHYAYLQARPETARAGIRASRVEEAEPRLPSVILLVLDTVRADALTVYGAKLDTTPRLQRFVESSPRAVVFPWAFAPSSWTIPSHASLLTGLLPSGHGAHEGAGGVHGSPFSSARLRADRTLAEVLGGRGYRTAFLTANPLLLRVRGLERGFDVMRQPPPPRPSSLLGERLRRALAPSFMAGAVGDTPKAERVAADLLEFFAGGPAPVFVVANFMEPHTPYSPPWSEAGRFTGSRWLRGPSEARLADPPATVEQARKRYLEEIRGLDRQLGRLLDQLAEAGHLDTSWLVITSDHGEAFMEHGSTNHGSSVYNEQVRVPLIVQPPLAGVAPDTEAPVSLLDVATTIAAVAGVPGFGDGRDLTASGVAGPPVAIEFFGNRQTGRQRFSPDGDEPAAAVVMERLKLIRRGGGEELYDLASDPAERRDRLAEERLEAQHLRSALPSMRIEEPVAPGVETELSPDELEALRALGYLD